MSKYAYYFLFLLMLHSFPGRSQLVTLSPGFGNYNGFTYRNMQSIAGATIAQRAWSVMVQPDGKIIVAGESANAGILLRMNDDGTPDPSFGTAGKAVVFAGRISKAILQPDGKIVMAITGTGDFTIVRYNNDGTPDVSFGNRGIAIVQAGYQGSYLGSIALQPDGKIVAVGYADYFVAGLGYNLIDAAVVRLTENGQPDISFDTDGKKLVPVQVNDDVANAVAIDLSDPAYPTGKIVIAGYCTPASGRRMFTARILPSGNMDNAYGSAGIVEETFNNNTYFSDVKVFSNGKIAAGGASYSNSTFTFDLTLIKYNADGTRDNSFSGDGLSVKPSGTSITAAPVMAMQLLPANKLLVASGRAGGSPGSNFAISRYNEDGSLDNSFDGDGVLPTLFTSTNFDDVKTLAVDNNGRYIVAGESQTNYNKTSIGVSRFNSNGSIDAGFNGTGKYVQNFPASNDNGRHILQQPDGKLLVAATVVRLTDAPPVQSISEYVILRYNADGTADNSWGNNGTQYTGLTTVGDNIRMALQGDGKLIIAGTAGSNGTVTVARFSNTGVADPGFDGDGKISFTAIGGYSLSRVAGVGLTGGGQVIVSCVATFNFSDEIGLIRLNSNGSIDNTYGGAGLARVGLGSPVAMLIQPDDKVLLTVTNNPQGNVKRILATGSQDAGFNGNGTVNILTPVNSAPSLLALTRDAAGNILVAGSGNMGAAGTQALLAKITPAGQPDGSFGTNGVVMTDITTGTEDLFNSVSVQTNGVIVAAGTLRRGYNDQDLLLAKFSATGVRDLTLNNNIGYFSADLRTGSFEQVNHWTHTGTVLYGTGNIRTDQGADLLLVAIDLDAAVLPVYFSDFTVQKQSGKALLEWTIQSAINIDHYLVERSADGSRFHSLGTVAAEAGNNYHFTDEHPLAGKNYYRVRGMEPGGSSSATAIKMLTFPPGPAVMIYPNPVQSELRVLLPGNLPLPIELSVKDNMGRLQYHGKVSGALNTINVRQLPAGIYYVFAGEYFQGSFIKN